jgi:hypothetical protein
MCTVYGTVSVCCMPCSLANGIGTVSRGKRWVAGINVSALQLEYYVPFLIRVVCVYPPLFGYLSWYILNSLDLARTDHLFRRQYITVCLGSPAHFVYRS